MCIRCHSRVVLLIASTVTDYSMLTPSDQLTNLLILSSIATGN